MFIQTEITPNPDSLKFLPGRLVLESGTASFYKDKDCSSSPLAKKLLEIPSIIGVFFGHDFITLTKASDADWFTLKPLVLGHIMEHFVADLPVILDKESDVSPSLNNQDPLVQQIQELIDTKVRPAVAQDGGDIVFYSFENGVVYLKMHGACAGCPSSSATLKSGIENMLKYYVPEVLEVRAVSE